MASFIRVLESGSAITTAIILTPSFLAVADRQNFAPLVDPKQTNRDNSGNLTGLELSAESAVIMEASGGQVLLEKNADEKRPPASVTKVMTLLLIFDALADGTITPDTEVTTSEYAASMGGSQVFLEADGSHCGFLHKAHVSANQRSK